MAIGLEVIQRFLPALIVLDRREHNFLPVVAPSTRSDAGFLRPVASSDDRRIQRRVSRTDMDFETALQNEGTFMLREGPDVNQLGAIDTPAKGYSNSTIKPAIAAYSRSTPMATPNPPAPAPNGGGASSSASSSRTNMNGAVKLAPSSPSSSSQELFYDAEDGERQTNRRSLYRSPGTSSSPDLATLLRKAKERGEPVNIPHHLKKDAKRRESPPPMPETRPRSSTTVGPSSTPSSPVALKKPRDLDTSTRGFSGSREAGTKVRLNVRLCKWCRQRAERGHY